MEWDYDIDNEEFNAPENGLFIVNEGCFQYGNASLSFYNPSDNTIENEIFLRANGMKLGDVAQSMTIYGDKGWVVVNNSHVIFAIDLKTFREKGRIENLTSPRYIHFVNDKKAYVSQLWDNKIYIVDPSRYEVTGYIEVPGMSAQTGSTERMVQIGQYVYCTCWSYQNTIIKIDTETDRVVDALEVGIQPRSLIIDRNGRLWTITDGGYEGSPFGYEIPALVCVDPDDFSVVRRMKFKSGDSPRELIISGDGSRLYWINESVWRMDVSSEYLPARPFIEERATKYYSLTVAPGGGDIYVGDAIDYQQPGIIYRYSSSGNLLDQFYVGVTPAAYCWK
ncbi:MAG: glutaminyl-peptide cyclotransferase [Muribaculaceae bacterium]|nr:glutaminyl-peptide cyclotransferase [Muribaculaceae bacterium]